MKNLNVLNVVMKFLSKLRSDTMVLFAIVGELGAGKTLALSYLAWNNWFKKKKRLYSNYNFYGMPFTPVNSLPNLDKMKEGFFAGDELWLWVDSRTSKAERNRIISSILLKSRKRGITIAYTTQTIQQIDKRIRDITDFIAYPLMSVNNDYCRIEIFRGPRPTMSSRMKNPVYFVCEPIYSIYNTYEEVRPPEEKEEYNEIFQPITQNPAWIKFLKNDLGLTSKKMIEQYSNKARAFISGKMPIG